MDTGDARACVEAGDAYADAEAPDFERAIVFYTRGCDEGRGDGEACAQVAYLLREDDDPDVATIAAYLGHACALGLSEACLELGFMHLNPVRGAPRDLDRARTLLQPLCDDGLENGCLGVSVMFAIQANDVEMGLSGRPDAARARRLYEQSCEAYESGPGCFQLDRLRRAHHFESVTYSVRLTTVEGAPSWLRPGQRCEITVEWTMDEDPVGIRALCAGRPVFPTDSSISWSEEEGLADALTSELDGNPSLLLSPTARTFELSDDATGRLGALRLTGTVTRVPPPSE